MNVCLFAFFRQLALVRLGGVLLLSTVLGGCSTWFSADFRTPDVQLVDVELVYAKMLEQEFLLKFRIDNPNSDSLPVRGINYTLHLNGTLLGRGQSNQWLTVPANSTEYVTLRAHTNLWRHVKSFVALFNNPNQPISYALEAELKTGLIFNKTVPVRRQGSFTPGEYLNTF